MRTTHKHSIFYSIAGDHDGARELGAKDIWLRAFILLLITAFFLTTLPYANAAQEVKNKRPTLQAAPRGAAKNISGPYFPSGNGEEIGIIAAAVGVVVVLGVVVYFAVRHGKSIKGCTAANKDGLQLINEGDQSAYTLTGDVGGLKGGERVRVTGKKVKAAGAERGFVVSGVRKDYGPCVLRAANP
jgi:hypothetical protein